MNPSQRVPGGALRRARERLLERGELPPDGLLGATVARSWQRCVDAGLAPGGRLPDAPFLEGSHLALAVARQQELLAHARPVMEYLHGQIRDSGSLVVLADDRGVLLQTLGDVDFVSRAERVALMSGASWHERHRGTNAVGTALAEGAPVVVHGSEHFLERNAILTCAAAPIAAPNGRFLGVLDISGDRRSRHPHTFGLVRAAAQMIENRLFDAQHGKQMRLRFHPLAEGIGTVAEGVVALSDDGWIVGANQAALTLLGLAAADVAATPLARVLDLRIEALSDWARHHGGAPLLAADWRGGRIFVRVEPAPRATTVAVAPRLTIPQDALAALDTGDAQVAAAVARGRKVLGKPIAVLLQGESGVGKELFARALHESGPRRDKPFIAVNCAALPEHLIEAELFGHAPGAFTGARRDGAPGLIRAAHGGTLFLDEIGDMPLTLQTRLLRVLQERQVTPVGGAQPVAVDFCLISATHCDIKAAVDAQRFRGDLYYRINDLALRLPALRERDDLAALVARLLAELAPGRHLALEAAVAARFADYRWPGNLRQLASALRTACALLDDDEHRIGWAHLPADLVDELQHPGAPRPAPCGGAQLRAASDALIAQTVAAAGNNMTEAARRLGISRNTLYRRLKQMGLNPR